MHGLVASLHTLFPSFRPGRSKPPPLIIAGFLLVLGCSSSFSPPAEDRAGLRTEPPAPLAAVSPVLRLRLPPPPTLQEDWQARIHLFSGKLSSNYRSKLRRGELSSSLLERQVPIVTWWAEHGIEIAPQAVLTPEEHYSLALEGHGLLGEFTVSGASAPVLFRIWPDRAGGATGTNLYCSSQPLAPDLKLADGISVPLSPGPAMARVQQGVGTQRVLREHCVSLEVMGENRGSIQVPPPELGSVLLDPVPLLAAPPGPWKPRACGASEQPLAFGCIKVLDDRLRIEPPAWPSFWVVGVDGRFQHVVAKPGVPLIIAGLTPQTAYSLTGVAMDPSGHATDIHQEIVMDEPMDHLIINEVLANPVGPEPAQEWVELVNTGMKPVDLSNYALYDIGGETPLPNVMLSPGQYALIVNQSYVGDGAYDPPPSPDCLLVPVPQLGKSGLLNSGEVLMLRHSSGEVVSRFPAQPKPAAGISVARRGWFAVDEALDSFALHALPGASPGSENSLQDPELAP